MAFFDFEYKIRTDPSYYSKVEKAIINVVNTTRDLKKNGGTKVAVDAHHNALIEYLRLTRFNVTPLLGYYYPNFQGGPFSLKDFPFAHCYYNLCMGPGSFTVFRTGRQVSKCVAFGSIVTLRNKKTMEVFNLPIGRLFNFGTQKIQENDGKFLFRSDMCGMYEAKTDRGFVDIKSVYKTIPYKVWRIQTNKGKRLKCADEHLVFDENYNEVYVRDLKINSKIITSAGIERVEKISVTSDKENMYDIALDDSSDHRYFTNGILSHNTTNHGIFSTLMPRLIPGLKIAVIVPRPDQLGTIQNKFREIDMGCRFYSVSSEYKNNMSYKEYPHPNGQISTLSLWYILTDPGKIRGTTADFILFDEYQDFNDTFLPVVQAIQTRNQAFASTTFSGTSKTTNTALERKWLASSMSEWIIPCEHCGFTNIPTIKEGVLDMIQPKGMCCKKCGGLLNVRKGHWEASVPGLLDLNRWGFHVPQVIVPANTEDKAIWMNIYQKSKEISLKDFSEEFLGEATEEGSAEITTEDLQRICILGDRRDLIKVVGTRKDPYEFRVSGCDWGGSDYNPASHTKVSYTVHVVLGILPNGMMHILNIDRYSGMAYDDISGNIAKTHKQFKCSFMGGDYGGSAVYVNELKKLMDPLKVISLKYGLKNKYIDIPKQSTNFGNMYSLNRTDSITNLYLDIKTKKILAPKWEQMQDYLKDILNLVRVPKETPEGVNYLEYQRIGSQSDDTVHALNYAVTIGKLLKGIPLFESAEKQRMFHNYITTGRFQSPIIARNMRQHSTF